MICLVGNRPILQVGNHQIVGYEVDWIETALRRASLAADRDDFPFIEEVRDGVIYYLEHKCSLRLLPIEDLYGRMRHMLDKIGCSAIARELRVLTPPLTLSLARTARKIPAGFELGFFQELRKLLDEVHQLGAEEVRFTEIQEATLLLAGTRDWDSRCEKMQREVLDFLEMTAQGKETANGKLALKLEAA
ncbi:hypothetical protein [Roseibacillus ishigakijimensis]|uniref:Uncharacterized protein n=1 Tax=Roseibacillus ishigakijimensis TaxID=454146 RepID=A0A934RP24_9BACT|nr:hypothetical protein [Roseibacillus ishigakijimensis]MBK1834914.1 hypothetical protein [Roseibacillus ishigakijimensis]